MRDSVPSVPQVGIRTLARIRLRDQALSSNLKSLMLEAGGQEEASDGPTCDVAFSLASVALEFGRRVATTFGRDCRIGIASGEWVEDGHRLRQLADLALDSADPGQVALCLATVELCRSSTRGSERFVELGVMRSSDSGDKARLYLLDTSGSHSAASVRPPARKDCFIGRQKEAAQLRRMLDLSRLVTVVGPVGVGKSALLRRLAIEAEGSFEDGIASIDLSQIDDERQLVPHLCQAFEARRGEFEQAADSIASAIGGRRLLLILDGCERWVPTLRGIVPVLLDRCENLQVMSAGFRRLRLHSETVFRLGGLETPAEEVDLAFAAEYDAVGLFLERAEQVDPTFKLTDSNLGWVVRICRRLEGSPLAIGMAAAKVSFLSPRQIHDRLEFRLGFLKETTEDGPERHSTLGAAVEWQTRLLSPAALTLLRRLSVLSGAFTMEVAAEVCGDALSEEEAFEAFEELNECSLLRSSSIQGDERRFYLGETVKLHAGQMLRTSGEGAKAVARKAEWAERLGQQAMAGQTGPEQSRWLARVDAAYEDIREVVRLLLRQNEPERAAKLAHACWSLWYQRGFQEEGIQLFSEILRHPKMLEPRDRARYFNVLAVLQLAAGQDREARASAIESARTARRIHDRLVAACALSTLGAYWFNQSRYLCAKRYYARAAGPLREAGDDARLMSTLGNLLACCDGPVTDEERALVEEATRVCARCQNLWYEGTLLINLAEREIDCQNFPRALPYAVRGIVCVLELEDSVLLHRFTRTLVKVLDGLGRVEEAIRWSGFGKMIATHGEDPYLNEADPIEALLEAHQVMENDLMRGWYEEGRSWSTAEAKHKVLGTI